MSFLITWIISSNVIRVECNLNCRQKVIKQIHQLFLIKFDLSGFVILRCNGKLQVNIWSGFIQIVRKEKFSSFYSIDRNVWQDHNRSIILKELWDPKNVNITNTFSAKIYGEIFAVLLKNTFLWPKRPTNMEIVDL